ncbi:hypothetical protein [Nonomuraea insulae]|uniref:Uncharacterized protein n=1 Tax=Nonomuraea insulae TaxID=1616787 RepID=A0ABW1CSE1_9ACTN
MILAECACEVPEDLRLGPCATHEELIYRIWLADHAPRLAAAEGAEDPLEDSHMLAEANRLADFIRQARQLEEMPRDHATGGRIQADAA